MKTITKVFIIIGMILGCVLIFPIIVGAIALRKLDTATCREDIFTLGWLTVFFCSVVGGIFMLCLKESDFSRSIVMSEKEDSIADNLGIEEKVFYGNVMDIDTTVTDVKDIDIKGMINSIFQCVDMSGIFNKVQKGAEYVVQIPVKYQKGFDAGKYWFMENSETGKQMAILMKKGVKGRNEIVAHLGIKKQDIVQRDLGGDILNNYHNLYMQQKMNEIACLVETALETVQRIEKGQMDDRIALLDAGRRDFLLALSQQDEVSRPIAIANARSNISLAQKEILKTFERRVSEFNALPKTELGRVFKEAFSPGYFDKRDNEYDEIQEYYYLYLQSTRMLAGSYLVVGEVDNAKKIFDEAIKDLNAIDYKKLKTIEYAHKGVEFNKIYETASAYMIEEKNQSLNELKEYDGISISLTGEFLLEVVENAQTISSSKVEQR